MTFGDSVSTCLKKYFVFEGRASRSEYWWFQLLFTSSYSISTIFEIVFENDIAYIFLGITLFTFIPAISASIRRLHDTNRSGFFLLISLIPLIGGLVLLFFLIPVGTKGKNRFGPDPLNRITRNRKKKTSAKIKKLPLPHIINIIVGSVFIIDIFLTIFGYLSIFGLIMITLPFVIWFICLKMIKKCTSSYLIVLAIAYSAKTSILVVYFINLFLF